MSVVEGWLFQHAFSAHKTQVLVKPLVPSFCRYSVTLDHLVLLALLENLVPFLRVWVETGMPCIGRNVWIGKLETWRFERG